LFIHLHYLIYHRHEADGPGAEEGAGKDWFLDANGMHMLLVLERKWVNNQPERREARVINKG